jgi:dipeptidyl aminopeptidase/acylaminoacyl peptidase
MAIVSVRLLLAVLVVSFAGVRAWSAPALEVYGALPAIEFMSLSPSGDRFAFVAVDGETRKLFVRQVGGDALVVANVGAAKVRDIEWGDENHVVAMVSRTITKAAFDYKQEATAAVVLDVATGKSFRALENRADSLDAISGFYGAYQADGRWWGLFRSQSRVTYRGALYRVDLESGAVQKLADSGSRGFGWVIGPHGEIAARTDFEPVAKVLNVTPGPDGKQVLLSRRDLLSDIGVPGLGRTADTVVVVDKSGDTDLYEEMSLRDGARTSLPQSSDYDDLIWDPTSHLLVGAMLKGDRGALFFDPARQARYNAIRKAFPQLQVRVRSFNRAFDRLIVFTEGGDDAGTYWLLDARSGQATALGAAYPAISHADVGPTRWFTYKAQDGLQIEAVLTLPPGRPEKGLPLIVLPHGGPLDIEDRLGFDWWAQAFASRGYAVLKPNYRGSGGRGAAFRKAGLGQWGRKMQTDLSDGVAALAAQGVVDPKRVCIVGGSYGGYAALAGVTMQSGIYRCAVSYGGLSDMGLDLARLGDSKSYASAGDRYMRAALGVTWAGDPVVKTISPVYFADKASAPVLLIHGKDDTVVTIAQSREMEMALRHAGKSVELKELEGEDHWLSKQKTRTEMLRASVGFVEKWNPPG